MGETASPGPVVCFGPFRMDRRSCELLRDGERLPLQIQPFRVLEALVDAAGQVVTRDELRRKIWPETVYVDFDHGLNNAVNRLRQALQESAETPRYIETLPRIGYRFVHELSAADRSPEISNRARRTRWSVGLAATAIAIAVTAGILFKSGESVQEPFTAEGSESAWTDVPEARDAYLRGRALFEKRNPDSLSRSIEYLRNATKLDPQFAEAHALLAQAYATAGGNSLIRFLPADEVRGAALAAAQRAIQADPGLADAHAAMAVVLDRLEPWSAETDSTIESAYRFALGLDPATARHHLFFGNFLSSRGRNEEALEEFRAALRLEPLSANVNSRLGAELVATGHTEEGLGYLEQALEIEPWQFNARLRLGWAQVALQQYDPAQESFEAAERASPGSLQAAAGIAYLAAINGDRVKAEKLLEKITAEASHTNDPFNAAIVYVGLRDREHALDWLSRVADESRTLHKIGPFGIQAPIYDWLREDPRFTALEQRVMAGIDRIRAPSLAP